MDSSNYRVREVNHSSGLITTVAGNGGSAYSGDGGPATAASLSSPSSVAVDYAGNLFIADAGNNVIREVAHGTGIITTVAGNGTSGYSGDGGAATAAELSWPNAVAVDSAGNVFICEGPSSDRVREVLASTGTIVTVAGNGTAGYSGDGGQATSAELNDACGITVDNAQHLFIADNYNERIREVNLLTGIITTVAGDGNSSYSGDGGQATAAGLGSPSGVALDGRGALIHHLPVPHRHLQYHWLRPRGQPADRHRYHGRRRGQHRSRRRRPGNRRRTLQYPRRGGGQWRPRFCR